MQGKLLITIKVVHYGEETSTVTEKGRAYRAPSELKQQTLDRLDYE